MLWSITADDSVFIFDKTTITAIVILRTASLCCFEIKMSLVSLWMRQRFQKAIGQDMATPKP